MMARKLQKKKSGANKSAGKTEAKYAAALDPKVPEKCELKDKWQVLLARLKPYPLEKRQKAQILIIGSGLSALAASAALAKQGYKISLISPLGSPFHESSVYLRCGLNAFCKYANNGDSNNLFFQDTLKYGAYCSRPFDIYRMAQLSGKVLDICIELGVPFMRDKSGLLAPRHYPGGKTPRSFQTRGLTGRQLLTAFYSAFLRYLKTNAKMFMRRELIEIILHNGAARGIIARNIISGEAEAFSAEAIVLACGGYCEIYNNKPNPFTGGINALHSAYLSGAGFANPAFSLACSENMNKWNKISPDYPPSQRSSGGLWVDYHLSTNLPGLFAIGEANFSVHGANPMPGNAPLQELADGLFILPATLGNYLANSKLRTISLKSELFSQAISRSENKRKQLINIKGKMPPIYFHKKLSSLMREKAGFIRYNFRLRQALSELKILHKEFYSKLFIPPLRHFNLAYEEAYKLMCQLDIAELIIKDALLKPYSCGAHFRIDDKSAERSNLKLARQTIVWFYSNGLNIAAREPGVENIKII